MLSYGPPHYPCFLASEEFQKLYDASNLQLRPHVPEEFQDSARRVLTDIMPGLSYCLYFR